MIMILIIKNGMYEIKSDAPKDVKKNNKEFYKLLNKENAININEYETKKVYQN